jgi:O-antigen/teichoic acid export membrane protein
MPNEGDIPGPSGRETAEPGERRQLSLELRRLVAAAIGHRQVRQAGLWTGATLLAGLLGLLTQTILAGHLSVAEFAAFGVSLAFLQFVALFFEFGLFVPAARLAARTEGSERRRIAGAALLLYLPVGLLFGLAIFGASFVVDDVFEVDASEPLRAAAFLSVGFPFIFIGQQLAQGSDRLHAQSLGTLAAQLIAFSAIAVAIGVGSGIGAVGAVELRALGVLLAGLLVAVLLRPLFARPFEQIRRLGAGAREYGLAIYAGRVTSVGTFNLDVLMLAALADVQTVAVYTIARALATFASVPADGIAAAIFPRMARQHGVQGRDLRVVAGVTAASAVVVVAVGAALAALFFSDAYADLPLYAAVLAVAYGMRGISALYMGYLAARGRGRALRDAGLALTGANLAFNAMLIPAFGGVGAAVASVLAIGINLAMLLRGYRRSLAHSLA